MHVAEHSHRKVLSSSHAGRTAILILYGSEGKKLAETLYKVLDKWDCSLSSQSLAKLLPPDWIM